MDGIVPDSIRIEIINALFTIDALNVDYNYITNASGLQAQAKWVNDSVKIGVMNFRIHEEKMYWAAGRNIMTSFSFMNKEKRFGRKFNIAGFDYYRGGIFEFLHHRMTGNSSTSNFVKEFDWRTRHDASTVTSHYFNSHGNGWVTPAEGQLSCQSCYVFASVHAFADYINVFSNQQFNYNFSEEEALICGRINGNTFCGDCTGGGSPECILSFISTYGIHKDSSCVKYLNSTVPTCDTICDLDTTFRFAGHYAVPNTTDSMKVALIKNGPITCGLKSTGSQPLGHVMELVAYKIVEVWDTVYISRTDTTVVLPGSSLIGKVSWIFKDSDDPTRYFRYCGDSTTLDYHNRLSGPVNKKKGTGTYLIKPSCKDEDGDGYYWWGVGPLTQDCGCPPGTEEKDEDCNDNDPLVGPYATPANNPDSLPLYSCTPNNCTKWSTPIEIHSNTTWSGIRHMNRDVIIYPGATLTVDGQVFFSPGTQIKVQKQAQLILSSSDTINPPRLTSGCGNFWGGIEVWGDPRDPQSLQYQGKVTILNGVIENAACGIKTLNSNYYPDNSDTSVIMGLPTGGIIDAQKAIFRNNVIGVELFPYRNGNHANQSRFTACRFETSARFPDGRTPAYGIKLMGVNNVNISGCTYINSRPDSVHYTYRGSGLYAYNAVFTVNDTNISGRMYDTKFEKLNYGVYSLYSPLGFSSISLKNASFNSNRGSIYLSGFQEVSPVNLNGNKFSMLYNLDTDNQYGIYLENCSGFKVTQDTITGNSFAGGNQFGIIVNNSGPENNYIYHNVLQNLKVGLQGLNINRNSDALIETGVPVYIPTGLRFICNKFEDVGCTDDFLINENLLDPEYLPGIAYNQRNASNITNPTQEPAGNIFTQNHGNQSDAIYDINISPSVSSIIYTYHSTSNPPGLRLKPDDLSDTTKVSYIKYVDFPYTDSLSCSENFYPLGAIDDLQDVINDANNKIDSLTHLLAILVDAGSTCTLKTTVENSFSNQSYPVYQDLMAASPYLSDTVIKSSIIKESVLPNTMIRDIMVANPQSVKSDELLNKLDERITPMPDSMWVEILKGLDIVGAKERLENELSGWIQRKDIYFNTLAEHLRTDTINVWACDSLISLYQSDHRLLSHFLLTQYYLDQVNFPQVSNTMQNIPLQFELKKRQSEIFANYLTLVNLLPQLFIDSMGYFIPNGAQSGVLEELAENESSFPCAWARNILIASGLINYQEPVIFESNNKSSGKVHNHFLKTNENEPDFIIFPNPAKDYCIIKINNLGKTKSVKLLIYNTMGHYVGSYSLSTQTTQQLFPLEIFKSGAYLFQIMIDGVCKTIQKVVVLH
ncbi:MAG: C1 family peptidase [Bacteroidota bacterium]